MRPTVTCLQELSCEASSKEEQKRPIYEQKDDLAE